MELQPNLPRVIQDGEFERVGTTKTIKVDVRVISSTNKDLEQAASAGYFRPDLMYRLMVLPIMIPPLRYRPEDIPLLTTFFLSRCRVSVGKQIDSVPNAAMDAIVAYEWPGNVRELQNVIERAVILSEGSTLHLERAFGGFAPSDQSGQQSLKGSMVTIEKQRILNVLMSCSWKINGDGNAASRLGMSPSTLRSRLKSLGITRS